MGIRAEDPTIAERQHNRCYRTTRTRKELQLGRGVSRSGYGALAGHIKPGSVSNEIVSHMDWLPTFLAMAGDPDITGKLLKGYQVGKKNFKVHLDGYNLLPYLNGQVADSPRKEFFYFSDDGDLLALRYDNWKLVFGQQRVEGTLNIWSEPFVKSIPWLYNLRTDPYEHASVTSNNLLGLVYEPRTTAPRQQLTRFHC
jgi:arylsulfatase A-like enzyme